MNPYDFIWQAVVILAFGAMGAGMYRAVSAGQSDRHFPAMLRRARHLYLAIPLLSALPWVNYYVASRPSLQWDMPDWLQLHWAALSWCMVSAILAYFFGFCSAVAWASTKWGRRLPALFSVVVLLVVQLYAIWSSQPNLPPLDNPWTSSDGVILQTSPYTCVPASGANIAALLGVHTTEKELAALCHTTRDGTFPAGALSGLRQLGLVGRKVTADSRDIRTVRPPAMLFVLGDTHAVVYARNSGGLLEIWNPSAGKAFITDDRLRHIWTGHALEFSRARD
jgi:hypothetical protein